MRERYQGSLRLRLVVPILSALLVVIGFLSMMSEALLSNSLQVSAEAAARKIAGLIARDPDINADLISDVSDGIKARLLETLESEELVLAVGVYAVGAPDGSQSLILSQLRHEGMACLVPDKIDFNDVMVTRPPCEQQVEHRHSVISVTHAIEVDFGEPLLYDNVPDDGLPESEQVQQSGSSTLGSIRLAYSLEAATSMKSQYRFLIVMVAGLLVLFSGMAADRLARYMLAPIHMVHLALQEATEGNLKTRLEETTNDELGAIAKRFNIMVQRLDENREQIRSHNRDLEKRVEERTEELSRAYRELQTLDKVKDNLLSNVSHEMRTPLTSIVASAEILSDFTDQDEAARQEFLEIIRKEAARLLLQINSILDMAKMEAEIPVLFPESADLGKIVSRVTERFELPTQAKKITLNYHHGDTPLVLDCDAKYISKVIASLLENAISFSPENGAIDIHFVASNGVITLEVIDDGPGVPEEKRGLLFTVFGQLSNDLTDKPKGLGMGLAISKRIAEAHGGDLRYIHKKKRGACFQLTLPVSVPAC